MTIAIAANNAASIIVENLGLSSTEVVVAPGTASLFPNLAEGSYFVATLSDKLGALREIVWVTAVVGDVMTVVRGKEGTIALSWPAGTLFQNLWTAGQIASIASEIFDVQFIVTPVIITEAKALTPNSRIGADTSDGGFTLPLTPTEVVGSSLEIFDPSGFWASNPLLITGIIEDASGNEIADGISCAWPIPMVFECRTPGVWTLLP